MTENDMLVIEILVKSHLNGRAESGSRGQCRKILNSCPPTDTTNSSIWNRPSEKNLRTS